MPLQGYEPDLAAIRADVQALAALRRCSAREGERESARVLAAGLARDGVQASIESYAYQHSYALAHGLHEAAGVAAALAGGAAGATLAAATLFSYEREVSGRSQWLRRMLPASEGANVIARVPADGARRMTLVLVAHHDAANTGLVWSPRLVAAGGERHLRRRRVDPFMAPLAIALAVTAAGCLLPPSGRAGAAGRAARAAGAAALATGMLVSADVGRSETVPGASDNATGVAAVLDLLRAIAAAPLPGVEVIGALVGCEEAGMGGMAAFLAAHGAELAPERTFVLGLDTLGAGRPIVCTGEGAMREQRYRAQDIALVDEGAALAREPAPERWRIGAWTDPVLALHRGLPCASLLSMGPGYFPGYHHPTDTPEGVRWESVAACTRIAAGVASACAGRVQREA